VSHDEVGRHRGAPSENPKIGRPLRNAQQKRKRKHWGSRQLQLMSFENVMLVVVLVVVE
jgi:hypothetical protein